MATSTANLTSEFAAALGCKDKAIQARLIALGHASICARCGGSGQYSYNPMHGTMCYGCSGAGKVATKLTAKLLATVKAQVARGELQPYLTELARKAKAKAFANSYMDRFFAAWESLPTCAADKGKHWSDCSDRCHEINAFCAPMVDQAHKLIGEIENGVWDKATRKYTRLDASQVDAHMAKLEEMMALVAKGEELAPVKSR